MDPAEIDTELKIPMGIDTVVLLAVGEDTEYDTSRG
jgi:hypothetical protein